MVSKFLPPDSITLDRLKQSELEPIVAPSSQRIWLPEYPTVAAAQVVADTAYFVYFGRTRVKCTPKYVRAWVTAAAAGTIVAEVGLFSTPSAPNRVAPAQTMTKLVSGNCEVLTAAGMKGNAAAFATEIAAGTHVWGGFRCTATTTRPTIYGLCGDQGDGLLLSKATAGTLLNAGPWTTLAFAFNAALAWQAPYLRVYLD